MQYIEAYLTALLEGNTSPTVIDLGIIYARTGLRFDPAEAEKVINECKGKTAEELISQGVQAPKVESKSKPNANKKKEDVNSCFD